MEIVAPPVTQKRSKLAGNEAGRLKKVQDPKVFNVFLYELTDTNLEEVRVWYSKQRYVSFPIQKRG